MTQQQQVKKLSADELKKLAQEYVKAPEAQLPGLIEAFRRRSVAGEFSWDELVKIVGQLEEEKKKTRQQKPKEQPQPQAQQQKPKEQPQPQTQQQKPKDQPSKAQQPDGSLKFAFKVIRGITAALNILPYRVILQFLLPQTALGEVWVFVAEIPFLGTLLASALAGWVWFALQFLETFTGRDGWWIRGLAYLLDAALCFVTFPPLNGGIGALGLFMTAGLLSDVNWKNTAISIFAIAAWETLNEIEKRVFKGSEFGFWGVK